MDKIKELYEIAKAKIEENKETVIRISVAVVGALIGAVATALIINQSEMLYEEVTTSIDDDQNDGEEE